MTTSAAVERDLDGAEATLSLGRALGRTARVRGRGVLALSGHLGAGKTTLVKGLAEGLGVATAAEVTSPTFLRAVRWDGAPPLLHVDAYRMSGAADLRELGIDEDLAGGAVVAVEWPDVVAAGLPPDRIDLLLTHVDEGRRRVRLSAGGTEAGAWLCAALAAWDAA